jgi:RimJ/RimL family protein N-acetyltransferase
MAGAPLRLRPAGPEDLAWLEHLARDPATGRSLAVDAADRLKAELAAGELIIFETEQGERIGAVRATVRHRRSRIAELQTLMVDPAFRGRGFATAAVRAAARELIEGRSMFRVAAEVYSFNTPALATLIAAGFTREGVRRQAYDRHGHRHDGVLFGLRAPELH